MTEAMPFLQKYDITFLRPPTITGRALLSIYSASSARARWMQSKKNAFCLM